MQIRFFDNTKQKEARQVVGGMPYVIDTEQKTILVFFPDDRELDSDYYSCKITDTQIDVYLHK